MELKKRAPRIRRGEIGFLVGVAFGVFGTHFWLAFSEPPPPTRVTFEPRIEIVTEPPDAIRSTIWEPLPERMPVAPEKPSADELRERVDQAFLDRRRAGFVMWDDLTRTEQDTVHQVIFTYCLEHGIRSDSIEPNLVAVHPHDRGKLDRVTDIVAEQTRDYMALEEALAPVLGQARKGVSVPHAERITLHVKPDDLRLVNGEEAFLIRWADERARPGFYELLEHHRDGTGDIVIKVVWVAPAAHALLAERAPRMIELRSEARRLAGELFPRLYHEVR